MKRYIAKIGLAVVLVSLTACNDWFDVSPKTEIKAKDNFSSEQGFKDALTGCYLTMTSSSLSVCSMYWHSTIPALRAIITPMPMR